MVYLLFVQSLYWGLFHPSAVQRDSKWWEWSQTINLLAKKAKQWGERGVKSLCSWEGLQGWFFTKSGSSHVSSHVIHYCKNTDYKLLKQHPQRAIHTYGFKKVGQHQLLFNVNEIWPFQPCIRAGWTQKAPGCTNGGEAEKGSASHDYPGMQREQQPGQWAGLLPAQTQVLVFLLHLNSQVAIIYTAHLKQQTLSEISFQ